MDTILDLDPNGSTSIDDNSFDIIHPKQNTLDSVMVINFSNPQFLSKVEQVADLSQYLICPLKRNYRTFHRSLTVTFRAIFMFLTPTKPRSHTQWKAAKNLPNIRDRLLVPIEDNIFSTTVSHPLPDNVNPDSHHHHPTIHDIEPLRHYKPHIPQDPQSRNNLLQWLKYPGILKLVQSARKLQSEIATPPSKESYHRVRTLLARLTYNSAVLATSPAGPLACSIAISSMFSGVHSSRVDIVQPVLQTYLTKPRPGNPHIKPVLSIVQSLITNKDNWPKPPRSSISQIFNAQTIQIFTKITDRYLNSIASKEVEHFVPKKILNKVAVKMEGVWCAKNRALSQHSQLKRDRINPILRYNKSPLTIALVKYSHSLHDNSFNNRPTSNTHVGWKENQFRFQRFGIILRGAQLFKQVENSCIQCEQRKQKKFNIHMGLANDCIFSQITLFKYISVDLKGPFLLPSNKTIHILVLICLQTKFCETVILEDRSASTILEAFNVAFTLLNTPTRITADKEGGIVRIFNVIQQINDGLISEFDVNIEFVPAGSHHLSGLIERKIKQIAALIGTLDMSSSNMSVIKFSNTLRIITHYLNSIPYLVQFVGGSDKSAASGLNEFPIEIQFISPISWFNPGLEGCFNPLFVPSINQAQEHLLNKLGLLHETYTGELIPKLLLTLDRKRLTKSDTILPGQMVLIHTDEVRHKHSKAVLAQVTQATPGRDDVVRVVTVRYFKAKSCRIVNNRLVGKPIHITRGVETLSKLNQDALQQCRIVEYLHRNCKVNHPNQEPQGTLLPSPGDDVHILTDLHAPLSVNVLDPEESTTVWIKDIDHPKEPAYNPIVPDHLGSDGPSQQAPPPHLAHGQDPQHSDLTQGDENQRNLEQTLDTYSVQEQVQDHEDPEQEDNDQGYDAVEQAGEALVDPELAGGALADPDHADREQEGYVHRNHTDLEQTDDPLADPDYQDPNQGQQPNPQVRKSARTPKPKRFPDHLY